MRRILYLIPLGLFATAAVAAPFRITNEHLQGRDCQGDVWVERSGGAYEIVTDLYMAAEADEFNSSSYKRCTVKFDIDLDPGYVLDQFEFYAAGIYDLAQGSRGYVTVSNRAAGASPARKTLRYVGQDFGDFVHEYAKLYDSDLPFRYQRAGASIPMSTRLSVEVTHPRGAPGLSRVRLDDAGGRADAFSLCTVRVRRN